jgi:hypothetical protein
MNVALVGSEAIERVLFWGDLNLNGGRGNACSSKTTKIQWEAQCWFKKTIAEEGG